MLFARMSKLQALKNAALALVVGLVLFSCGASGGNAGSGLYCGGMFFMAAAFFVLVFGLKMRRDRQPRIPTASLHQELGQARRVAQSSNDLFVPDPLD